MLFAQMEVHFCLVRVDVGENQHYGPSKKSSQRYYAATAFCTQTEPSQTKTKGSVLKVNKQ